MEKAELLAAGDPVRDEAAPIDGAEVSSPAIAVDPVRTEAAVVAISNWELCRITNLVDLVRRSGRMHIVLHQKASL